MLKILCKKVLVLGIIILFFGISVAPGITANNSYFKKTAQKNSEKETLNDDIAEITVQLYKADGVESHTVFLTQEQSDKLDNLIKSFKADLDKAETMEETIILFYDLVVSLDELGLLPDDISIGEAQELVTDFEGINNLKNMIYRIPSDALSYTHFPNSKAQSDENRLCLVAGNTDETFFINPRGVVLSILFYFLVERIFDNGFLGDFLEKYFPLLYEFYETLYLFFMFLPLLGLGLNNFIPILRRNVVTLGYTNCWEFFPAHGWVFSNGLNGIKQWEGSLFGDLFGYGPDDGHCPGIFGFTGLHLIGLKSNLYLGCAMWIKIAEDSGGVSSNVE